MAEEERDYEAEARKDGWVPVDEWKGDPDKHKSAEQFVKDGEQINGILKSKIDRLESRINEMADTNRQLNEWSKRQIDKEKKDNEKLIKELTELRKQAVTEGDGEAFARADEQLNQLRTQPEPSGDGLSPQASDWLSHNSWYGREDELTIYADAVSDRLRAQGYQDQSQAFFSELTTRVKDAFPDRFGNKNREKPTGVESGTPAKADSQARTFDNLPAEAKAQYKRFARDIPNFTKDQYVEQYDWDE